MVEFKSFIDLSKINDSMELDSETVVAELVKDDFMLELRVNGYVDVEFEEDGDTTSYSCASNMPDELIEMFHTGEAYEDDRVNIIENNWFELFLYEKKGNMWDYTGSSDIWDCENMTDEELKNEMECILDEWVSNF